jgi:hypothetical protein
MNLDFTFNKYKEILEAISKSDYRVLGIRDFLLLEKKPTKVLILRHDVDVNSFEQIKYAKLEKEYGISTTYYFRYTKEIFNIPVINEIHSLGHEIGYHYEVLTKARGDLTKSIQLFKEELHHYQKEWNTVTVCPHGGAYVENVNGYSIKNLLSLIFMFFKKKEIFSRWKNYDIWTNSSIHDFGLIGDAYQSIDFSNILYLSDTGRSWDNKYKRIDRVTSSVRNDSEIKKSDDVIRLIKSENVDNIYLLIHFEQWKDNLRDWIYWYLAQLIRRSGKRILFHFRKA